MFILTVQRLFKNNKRWENVKKHFLNAIFIKTSTSVLQTWLLQLLRSLRSTSRGMLSFCIRNRQMAPLLVITQLANYYT